MRADETETDGLVGVFIETRRGIGGVVVAGVAKRIEARIAIRHGAAFVRFRIHAEGRRRFTAGISTRDAADRSEQARDVPTPRGKFSFFHSAGDVGVDGFVGPGEHRLVIGEDAA